MFSSPGIVFVEGGITSNTTHVGDQLLVQLVSATSLLLGVVLCDVLYEEVFIFVCEFLAARPAIFQRGISRVR